MCDSPVVRDGFLQDDSGAKSCNSEDITHELRCLNSSLEADNLRNEKRSFGSWIKGYNSFPYKFQLEQDVKKLQKQLQQEIELHITLENAIERNAIGLSSSSCLPLYAQELLSTIAGLEATVSHLEQEMVSLHCQVSQERNERRLAEYRVKHSCFDLLSHLSSTTAMVVAGPLTCDLLHHNVTDPVVLSHEKGKSTDKDTICQPVEFKNLLKGLPPIGLWDQPNQLSEEMVRCMRNIYISLADSTIPAKSSALGRHRSPVSPQGHLSNSSWWSSSERSVVSSWGQSPLIDLQANSEVLAIENVYDPYRVRGKLSWADIGNYGLAVEVSWMSVGKKQLDYAAGALKRFRTLVEQLAKVNPIHLNNDERLAFWINLYNALIMHAYLAYGVPRSDLKLFSLMQKAAYTVGGHSFSATAIEYVILKMKPPLHRPQIALLLALHKLKVSEDQRKSAIDTFEPLVAFGLSCGMYSSPAVRIYTAKNVKEELQEAEHDFIRASVGVSCKGRLLVPKMIHCYAKSFVDDSNLAVWISHYLPPHQAAFVEQCVSQRRRQSLLGSRNCGILHFDSHFRYLFLPDKLLQ